MLFPGPSSASARTASCGPVTTFAALLSGPPDAEVASDTSPPPECVWYQRIVTAPAGVARTLIPPAVDASGLSIACTPPAQAVACRGSVHRCTCRPEPSLTGAEIHAT